MTLSDLSIKRPVFAWMIMFGLIVFGAISWGRLGISQLPDVDFPTLEINVTWEGAAPEIMESEIVDRLEQAVIAVQGIRDITSSVRQGSASINIEFELDRDVDVALQEVQAYISRVRLPLNVEPARIRKSNPDDEAIIWLGVSSTTRSLRDLIVYVDRHIVDQFQIISGVGEIQLSGFADRNLRLWVNNDKLKQYELTILDLQQAISLEHIEIAAGYMEDPKKEMNIRVMGEELTPEDVGNILITRRGGQSIYNTTIRVKDVARVEDSLNDVRRVARIGGISGVAMGVKKQRGSNAVEIAHRVKAKMESLNKTLPEDIHIAINFDSTTFIEDSVHETQFTLILSAIVTGIVCWLFLGSWSSTFNVLLSIPTSIIGTFIILYFMGFTLNLFTLLGLALAVGIVVDDAIMVLENIVRHAGLGKDKVNAARDGAREITFAAVAASIAVMAIFLPVAFMKGIIGKFFFQFGITISGAVALSLLEAITLTPMRCSQFLSTSRNQGRLASYTDNLFQRLAAFYRNQVLASVLKRPRLILIITTLFFLLTTLIWFPLRKELIPPQDTSIFMVRLQTPVGSSLEYTVARIMEAEAAIKTRPEIIRYYSSVGGFSGGESNRGFMFITLKPQSERKVDQTEIMDWCRKEIAKIPGIMRVSLADVASRGFSAGRSNPIEFNIRGGDYQVLKEKSKEIIQKLEATGLYRDLDTDYREGMPEVRITPIRERAARSGVTMDSIGRTVNAAIGGVREGKFTNDGKRYDVRLRLNPEERLKPEDIANLQIRNSYGELVALNDVATIETVSTLQSITRRMRERSITISSNLAAGKSQSEALATAEKVSREVLPEGYRFFLSGSAEAFRETINSFFFAFLLGLAIAYMVLASQFNSFIHPVTVLLALPFGISGALIALLLTNQSINLFSGIGFILLAGIVKKNSILLIEFANHRREEAKLHPDQAMLEAGPIRLRPILMTSLATLAAALPPALALGPGAESRIPMAITIIGGVLVSTVFTLLVVPCAYIVLARFESKKSESHAHTSSK